MEAHESARQALTYHFALTRLAESARKSNGGRGDAIGCVNHTCSTWSGDNASVINCFECDFALCVEPDAKAVKRPNNLLPYVKLSHKKPKPESVSAQLIHPNSLWRAFDGNRFCL